MFCNGSLVNISLIYIYIYIYNKANDGEKSELVYIKI